MDLPALGMLRKLHATLAGQGIRLAITGAHGNLRDLLRRDGFAEVVGGIARGTTLEIVLDEAADARP
jgi:hypothetical protein